MQTGSDQKKMKYPSLAARFRAFLYDYVVIAGYVVLTAIVGIVLTLTVYREREVARWMWYLLDFAFILPVLLYFAIFETSRWQASWGKRRLGLKVVSDTGTPLRFTQSLSRSALKLVPWMLTHLSFRAIPGWPLNVEELPMVATVGLTTVWVLVLANIAVALVHRRHKTIYDMIAGTVVVPDNGVEG